MPACRSASFSMCIASRRFPTQFLKTARAASRRYSTGSSGRGFLRERRLKVLTNSYPLAETLIRDSKCRVALPGGEVYREQKLIVSPFEEDAIQHYSASRMFMSAVAIGPLGVIEGDPLIARAEAKLLKRADKLIVLADSSKFASRGSLVVCPLSRIAILITDRAAPPAALEMLKESGVQTVLVDAELAVAPKEREVA
jgi:DeoR family ulaG and ulaABCDEF operon transcriptional repressor